MKPWKVGVFDHGLFNNAVVQWFVGWVV